MQSVLNIALRNKYYYLMVLPLIAFYVIFAYIPMYGVVLAFKRYDFVKGIWASPWVGWENFQSIFVDPNFWTAFNNTIIISLGRLILEFPIPIIVALLLNELTRRRLKNFYQTVFTFPHFLSWVIVSGMMVNLLADGGTLNQFISSMGFEKISFLVDPHIFRALLFLTDNWKEMGYATIIYLAAIAGINPELYEAAYVDGANRYQQMIRVTWPGIKSTAVILLILTVGNMMNAGFDQILNMYNAVVYSTADIIDTYIYRVTFSASSSGTYETSTAIGLFKSVINFALLYGANFIAKKTGEEGLL